MKILVLGSGGREHALVYRLGLSPLVTEIWAAPGSCGTELEGARSLKCTVDDLAGLEAAAREHGIDLVVPGPELPLTLGVTDVMHRAGIPCFGPDKWCAQLEGSKAFAKDVMNRAGVPTARHLVVHSMDEAKEAIERLGGDVVVKADGLAAGKGVVVAANREEALFACRSMLEEQVFGQAGKTVVLEERLKGEEVSLLCLCDGERAVPLDSAQDHKAAHDNDQGPNTGGMGAYSPAPVLPSQELEHYCDLTVRPILRVLAHEGHPFVGVLYAGLMVDENGPKVLEYNVRFGDPECQALLARMESDLAKALLACCEGKIQKELVSFSPRSSLGVVIAAAGYPGSYQKGMAIEGLDACEAMGVKVFHSGTRRDADGVIRASGGRILCVTGLGDDLGCARKLVYEAVEKLRIEGTFYRRDIGAKGMARLA